MDILSTTWKKGPVLLAAFMVAVLGAGLFFNTFHSISRERAAVREHMGLTARVVMRAVEISLGRGMGRHGRMGMHGRGADVPEQGCPAGQEPCTGLQPNQFQGFDDALPEDLSAAWLRPDATAFFQELQQSKAVMFVTVFDETGGRPLTASTEGAEQLEAILETPRKALTENGGDEWEGVVNLGDRKGFFYARQTLPRLALLLRQVDMEERMRWMREGPPRVFLAVALDMTEHMKAYRQFRRNGVLQSLALLGAAIALVTLGFGLAKRRRAVERAAYLEQFQLRLLDSMPDGLITLDGKNRIQSANPAAHAILGAEPGGLVGRSCTEVPGEVFKARGWTERDVGDRRVELLSLNLPVESGEGQEAEPGTLVIMRDRTEFKEMEEHLAEARKLAALGALAAGVAHEIRNPLSALRGFAQFFAKRLAGKEPEETYAKTMVRESDRLNRVVTDMLYLAKPREVRRQTVDLRDLVDELDRLLRMDMDERGVRMDVNLHAETLQADPDQLKQVLLNLVLNSVQALQPSEGAQGDAWVKLEAEREDGGVRISVGDSGPGMTEEQRAQAFEPFFTTKDKGAGLGLAMVHAIMRRHEGRATIESSPGQGTTVTVFFPDADGEADD